MTAKDGAQPRERESRPSSCVVCGDPAIGYNYDATSCASCKAFFRRAVIGKRALLSGCQRNGICARESSLKPCRTCRYDKCIAGGMKPELVASTDLSEPVKSCTLTMDDTPSSSSSGDSQKEKSTLSLDDTPASSSSSESKQTKDSPENVLLEYQTHQSLDECDVTPCDPIPSTSRQENTGEVQIVANPFRIESKMEALMQNLGKLEAALRKLRISKYAPRLTSALSIEDFAYGPSRLGDHFEQMYSPAFDPFSEMIFPPEMLIKMRIVLDLTNFDYTTRKLWVVQDIIYTIEYMKALTIYQLLDDSSKKVLATSALVCTNLMVAYYSYTQNSDRTLFPDGSVVTWTPDIQEQAPGTTRFHTGIIAALREVNIDEREYSLLKNIIICNPNLDGLQPYDATLLQHEQERYTKTLLSYVLATRGVDQGPARFTKIISVVEVTNKITAWEKAQFITSLALGLAMPRNPFSEAVFHSQ